MTLAGKRILLTRSEEQNEELAILVRSVGGVPVLFPTMRLVPPEDSGPLDREIGRLSSFDWILFSSANAARFFCDRSSQLGLVSWPSGLRVASVGPGTTGELVSRGVRVFLEAEKHTAEGLYEMICPYGVSGRRFIIPQVEELRDYLAEAIRKDAGEAVSVVAYRNVIAEKDEKVAAQIVLRPPDVCVFASPSALSNLFTLLGEEEARKVLKKSHIAVIGEVTARAVKEREFSVDIMPETYTLKALMGAVEVFFSKEK
ncbi:MAG: uroporphyrinogen-III synthase [Syntrophorhabdaceae bacterium]|nr:uroporphyrinogen-III synthase [Syntrophorhabdaceae bacterium]